MTGKQVLRAFLLRGCEIVREEVAGMSYRVVLERDETGAWLARVPSVPGCHTYGRTLEQARRRIREALELWVGDAPSAELRFDIRLPTPIREELRGVRSARERSARAQRVASDALSRAARDLTEQLGLSMRDAAELLGISHQRVQQLVSGGSCVVSGARPIRR